jgi:cytochrome c
MRPVVHAAAVAAVVLQLASFEFAQAASPERGRAFALENCARYHAIGAAGDSPLDEAPPFRDLHALYPVEHLAEALAEGIVTGHAEMPEFRLDPEEAEDLIAYLKTLE